MNSPIDDRAGESRNSASVVDLLRCQRDLYRDLDRLAKRQRRLVAESDAEALLEVLGQRQRITDSLLEVGSRLAPHRDNWSQTRRKLPPEQLAEANRALAESSELLQRIIAGDEEDARSLSARKTQTAGQIQALQADRTAISAYAATRTQTAGRLDQMSDEQ